MPCTPGVTRTPTTLLGGSAVGVGISEGFRIVVEGFDVAIVEEVGGDSAEDCVGETAELVMIVLLLSVMLVGGGLVVTSLVGPAHKRNHQHIIVVN